MRKYRVGKRIKSVGEFEKSINRGNRWFMVYFGPSKRVSPKTTHAGFLTAWQYQTLRMHIYRGAVYEAKLKEGKNNE